MSPIIEVLSRLDRAEHGLLGIGIPKCPASALLAASLPTIAASRPGVVVESIVLATPEDWALRETELWPREIRVSRASAPALFLLRDGRTVATRPGAAPSYALDEWLTAVLGPPAAPVGKDLTDAERNILEETAARRAQHSAVKSKGRLSS
ncbi:MAG: hypothetical protein OEM67_07745 [Thermoleophilia bacterium]|nr:hypothetical protein [Thermoleophilia bacterium]